MADGSPAWASDGAPSDCVALALLGFFEHNFDLVVSGINPAPNLGHDVTYSGTVTAAMEAVIWGVPGIAFSLGSVENGLSVSDYSTAADLARQVVQTGQRHGFPKNNLLNVNIPLLPASHIKGFRITRQGMRVLTATVWISVWTRGVVLTSGLAVMHQRESPKMAAILAHLSMAMYLSLLCSST